MCWPALVEQAARYAAERHKGMQCLQPCAHASPGARGQHACAIARALGVKRILVHRFSGVLSAYGMALADVTHEAQEPCAVEYGPATMPDVLARLAALGESVTAHLCSRGFPASSIRLIRFLNLRYAGTDCAVMVPEPSVAEQGQHGLAAGDFAGAFQARYRREFGFCLHGRAIVVDDIRVRGVAAGSRSAARMQRLWTLLTAWRVPAQRG